MKKNFQLSVFVLIFIGLFFIQVDANTELPLSESPPAESSTEETPSAESSAEEEPAKPGTISMDFKDANLKDVLKVFSMQSGLNFIASEAVQDRKITLYLDKVPIGKAMDQLFKANNLTYDLDEEASIFIVKEWGLPEMETVTRVFYLKHATVSTSSIKEEMAQNLTECGDGGGGSGEGGESDEKGKWAVEDKAGITNVIKNLLSKYGSLIEDFRTNSLIVTELPSRMPVVARTIAALDVPVPQVILEVEMLDVSKGVVDKIGVDWPEILAKLDMTLVQRASSFPFGQNSRLANNSGNTATITSQTATPSGWNNVSWITNNFGPSIFTAIGSELILYYLRTQTDTRTLARPKILTLNNDPAEIRITTQEVVGEKKTTAEEGGAASVTYEAERYETGVSLRVTPQINLDTGEVTMFIVPTVAEANVSTTTSAFGATYWNPEVRSTKSIVKAKDGETIVIGGLIRNEYSESTQSLPFLGDIPLIGKLFQYKYKDKDRQRELLVFITPHIVKDTTLGLAQVKRGGFPEREQNVVSAINRDALLSDFLDNIEKIEIAE